MKPIIVMLAVLVAAGMAWGKGARTYYDDATMARMREKLQEHEWARDQAQSLRSAAEWYMSMSDQELWEFVPPPEQMRAINVCIGHDCPFCGPEITREAGHYPWEMDRDKPFKVTCPVCGRTFPENEFEPWNTEGLEGEPETGERIVDNGLGWVGPDGRRYWFVSYYIFWQRWVRDILGGMATLSRAYLVTGEPEYGHTCAVMMAKLASEYRRFDYRTQGYHEGRFNVAGRISDRIWTTGDDTKIALAYDAIYPIFDEDQALRSFLAEKGIEDPRHTIEQDMLNVMAEDVMGGVNAVGNMGMHQRTLCVLAIVLANDDPESGPTTAQMRQWLMSGPGRVEDLLWNGFWRDGLGAESAPGYSSSWCRNFYEIADLLPRLGVEIWDNPKLKKMADVGIDTAVCGRWGPDIGDCGGPRGGGPVARHAQLQGRAFTRYGEPRFAKLLAQINATSRDLFTDYFDEEAVAQVVEAEGAEPDLGTRDIGGYGLAVLEAGEGENCCGLTMYYGSAAGGHGHHDRLNIEMWSHDRPMLPDDGYPFPFTRPDFWRWRSTDTHKHYCVVVDETTHNTRHAGDLNLLVSTPQVQLADASAEIAYPDRVSLYRRTAALIDISPEASYLLDIFRVRGGSQHDWCFHGPIWFDLSIEGGELGPARTEGTLAGPNVPFGTQPHAGVHGGIPMNLLRAEGLLTGEDYGPLSAEGWARFGPAVLTKRPRAAIALPTVPVPAGHVRVFAHIYDYNEGANLLEVTAGGVTASVHCQPSGAEGYRWVSAEMDLPEPATEVTLTAREVGQKYLQLDQVVFVTDPEVDRPRVVGDGTSGYHGLYNVRRMSPQGQWRAMWRKPDEDLGLTMTMPAGLAQEVIVCDASPELQPGNPDVIQYVLGRRRLSDERIDAGGELLSRFVAAVEPHQGAAAISGVELLEGTGASPETVGVAVHREGAADLIHSALDRESCQWRYNGETLSVDAEYALVTLDDAGVARAVVVNGTGLRYGDFSLDAAPALKATVTAVDFGGNAIVIDAEIADPQQLAGDVVILGNHLQRASYTVAEAGAVEGGTRLGFGDVLFVFGMGAVAETDADAGVVTSDRDLIGYGRVDAGRHAGRWLYNDDRSRGFRISSVSRTEFVLENAADALDEVFGDADGDGRRVYWISDVGPADFCRIPRATVYQR
ncbi:MAG: heparinase II/III family protein [Armatimonadota bacterium]|nr:heparinase II/III family protein [Armatimonadota bacterium]